MSIKKITLATSKLPNLKKVFRSIQSHGCISRREIQADTALSWGATSQFVNMLIETEIAIQTKLEPSTSGKLAAEVELNPGRNLLIGLDITSHYICGVLTNLRGDELLFRSIPITDPAHMIYSLMSAIRELLEHVTKNDHVLAIGVSIPGNVDFENGILLQSVFSSKWKDINLREILEHEFGIPAIIRKDCECALTTEYYLGNIENLSSKSTILISLNYGVGMAFRHKGKIYRSFAHHENELGHITAVPGGTICNCGKRGCLEMYASKLGITRQFEESVKNGASTLADISSPNAFTYHTVRSCALEGDPLCISLFQQCGRLLGNTCANLSTLLEPEIIIIYGGLVNDKELWTDVFEETYYSNVFPMNQTQLIYSSLKVNAPSLGAGFCAQESILDDFLRQALLSYTESHKKE